METIFEFLSIPANSPSRGWISFGVGLLLFAALLLSLHRILIRQLTAMAQKTINTFDDILVSNLQRPSLFLILNLSVFVAVELSNLPLKDMNIVNGGIRTAFIVIFVWILERVLDSAIKSDLLLANSSRSTKHMISLIMRILVMVVGTLMVLDSMGVTIAPLLASLGVGSLAVALALQETLSNFFSGLYILADKPFQIGDFVEIDGATQGQIIKVGWRSTHIKTINNNIVVVPNAKAASSIVTNFDMQNHDAGVSVAFGVAYDSDLSKVEKICLEVAAQTLKSTAEGVKTFEPIVHFREFADSSINGVVLLRARTYNDRLTLQHHFIKALHDKFNKEGIEIPFPQRVIHQKASHT